MDINEYLSTLTSQIRCKKAWPLIENEIKNHIEDQTDAFVLNGMSRDDSVTEAVRQMGDPVETGVELDRIHRPRLEWKLLLLISVLSLAGLLVQYLICNVASYFPESGSAVTNLPSLALFQKQCLYTILGIVIMVTIYFIDYSVLGRYAIPIWFAFSTGSFLVSLTAPVVNGGHFYLQSYMYLFVPLFAGILYHYRSSHLSGLIKCGLFYLFTMFMIVRCIGSFTVGAEFSIICLLMVTAAIRHNWFVVPKKVVLITLWNMALWFPVLLILMGNRLGFMSDYHMSRLSLWLHPLTETDAGNYIVSSIHALLKQSVMIGAGDLNYVPLEYLPNVQYDYVIVHIISYYGILAGITVIASILFLIFKLFCVYHRQKNQLGRMIGFGCSLVFSIETIRYLLCNLGLLPVSSIAIPFFTSGFQVTLVTYILLGLILSIYRYQDIISDQTMKSIPHYRIKIVKEINVTSVKITK